MTIGDVLAAIALITVIGLCMGAALLLAALLFSDRTTRAAEAIVASPGRCFLRGLGVLVVIGLVALSLRAGPLRLVGDALWVALAAGAAVGGGGIVRVVAQRIQGYGTEMPPFASLTRAVIVSVFAGLLPVVGWFLITPLCVMVALGGVTSGWRRSPVRRLVETDEPALVAAPQMNVSAPL